MQPSYQDTPLYREWFERFKALCQKMWKVPASDVESRVTRIPLLDLLVIKRPDDIWEIRLPQIQLKPCRHGAHTRRSVRCSAEPIRASCCV